MKKIIMSVLALTLCFGLVGCGKVDKENSLNNTENHQESKKTSTSWPSNTMFPEPEGCTIKEVRTEEWKNYITVEWNSKEDAKKYIEKVKEVEGENAEVISQGETDETIYYGTYGVTITSMNEAENIVLYK